MRCATRDGIGPLPRAIRRKLPVGVGRSAPTVDGGWEKEEDVRGMEVVVEEGSVEEEEDVGAGDGERQSGSAEVRFDAVAP
eukprot:1683462-Rhodomonas_salina.2